MTEGRHDSMHHRRMESVLLRAVEALDRAGVPYALMGGLASAAIGRDRHTHDVDLFVAREDRERALDVLAEAGFRTERTDPEWLYKAFVDEVLVDVIFSSKGGILFDDEMCRRRRQVPIQGRPVEAISAEDLLVIKALTNAEHVPRHWYDGLGILAGNELDWPYLLQRARPHAARVASLLLYAVAEGIAIPVEPLHELCTLAMGAVPTPPPVEARHHLAAHLRQVLATDPRVSEPHLTVTVTGEDVTVAGQVATASRREAVERVLGELVGAVRVRCAIEVLDD
jgi:predicted nucleotidyltransferase